ncbi:MAG: glycosyltransferase family 2 protein [Candidatus Hydrogenedentota bacterium]|nr:MAG: glycosyltransferase family 2 protein [Candidatus Hydrogenedentota bacterium]
MRIGVVVVNYRSAEATLAAARNCRSVLGPLVEEIVLVDNGGEEADRLEGGGETPVVLERNEGFAAGVNAGIDRILSSGSRPDAFLLVNPDVRLRIGSWPAWFGRLREERVAAIGPCVRRLDGSVQKSFYNKISLSGLLLEAVGVHRWWHRIRRTYVVPPAREVGAVQGSCLAIDAEAWRVVGPFDPEYFLYHEETDWCFRARRLGYNILYDPLVEVDHEGGDEVPAGREVPYYQGALKLLERFGESKGDQGQRKRFLKAALRCGAALAGDPRRRQGLIRAAEML